MFTLTLARINDNGANTIGALFINDDFECYTLEDPYRNRKIKHITRIPAGQYEITLRTEGGFHQRYRHHRDPRVRELHQGMLWLRNVPDFEYIYLHIGNWASDTSGCILTGTDWTIGSRGRMIVNSTDAYVHLYNKVIKAMDRGERIFIRILDIDRI